MKRLALLVVLALGCKAAPQPVTPTTPYSILEKEAPETALDSLVWNTFILGMRAGYDHCRSQN